MELIVLIAVIALSGLIVGALARLAVPGPDPMSIWRTIALGIAGSLVGGVVAQLVGLGTGGVILPVIGGVLLLVAYRKWVQRRPITGPGSRGR